MMHTLSYARADTLLEYDPQSGTLIWKPRDRSEFSRDRLWTTWNKRWAGKEAGTIGAWGYRVISIDHINFFAHRIAWLLANGSMPEGDMDHINGDRADNRIENLRSVDRSANLKNSSRRKTNRSGVTGVYWDKSRQQWLAKLNSNRKAVFLGRFDALDDAVAARLSANPEYGFHPNHGRSA